MSHVVHCECGQDIEAESEDELVKGVEAHVSESHPEMEGKLDREQILEMAHEHSDRTPSGAGPADQPCSYSMVFRPSEQRTLEPVRKHVKPAFELFESTSATSAQGTPTLVISVAVTTPLSLIEPGHL